jgi:hypothetical protein
MNPDMNHGFAQLPDRIDLRHHALQQRDAAEHGRDRILVLVLVPDLLPVLHRIRRARLLEYSDTAYYHTCQKVVPRGCRLGCRLTPGP